MQGDEICSVEFKYKKLVDFCYRCGMLGHTQKSYNDFRWKDEDGNYVTQPRPQYGPHMRAPVYSSRKHFGSIRAAKHVPQINDVHPAKTAQFWCDAEQTTTDTPAHAEQRLFDDVEGPAKQSESTDAKRHMNLPHSRTSFNALIEVNPPTRNIITHAAGSSISPLPPTVTLGPKTPPLNAMETDAETCLSDKLLEISSNPKPVPKFRHSTYPIQPTAKRSNMDLELGLLLSEQVKAHLSLGRPVNIGVKRKHEIGSFEQIFKRVCTKDIEPPELQCSPNSVTRSNSHREI
ncbi:hypothetical protein SLE2022_145780 [Rubroshorea leprosula]